MRTEKSVRELLPIGSVVLLRSGKKAVMIYGVCQTNNETGEEFDYISVIWPEGNLGNGTSYMFNHKDIAKLLFRGADGTERDAFIDKLAGYYANEAKK